jgi:hypothetical protein
VPIGPPAFSNGTTNTGMANGSVPVSPTVYITSAPTQPACVRLTNCTVRAAAQLRPPRCRCQRSARSLVTAVQTDHCSQPFAIWAAVPQRYPGGAGAAALWSTPVQDWCIRNATQSWASASAAAMPNER